VLYITAKIFLAPIVALIMRARVKGVRHLFFRGSGIIVSNHWALTDPVLLAVVCPRVIHFMAKKELFENKFADFFFQKLLFAFPVNRKSADMKSLRKSMEVLKAGHVFGIFPEGSRSATGELDTIEKGAAFLALKTGAPIIPVYSDPNTFRKFRINMVVGEPMDAKAIAAQYVGKPAEVVTEAIGDKLRELKLQLEAL